jgi:hypothetical protein
MAGTAQCATRNVFVKRIPVAALMAGLAMAHVIVNLDLEAQIVLSALQGSTQQTSAIFSAKLTQDPPVISIMTGQSLFAMAKAFAATTVIVFVSHNSRGIRARNVRMIGIQVGCATSIATLQHVVAILEGMDIATRLVCAFAKVDFMEVNVGAPAIVHHLVLSYATMVETGVVSALAEMGGRVLRATHAMQQNYATATVIVQTWMEHANAFRHRTVSTTRMVVAHLAGSVTRVRRFANRIQLVARTVAVKVMVRVCATRHGVAQIVQLKIPLSLICALIVATLAFASPLGGLGK